MLRYFLTSALFLTSCQADNEVAVLQRLKESYPEWKPNALIDIGANVGGWTVRARTLFPDSKFLMLEAFPKFAEHLQKKKDLSPETTDFKIAVMSGTDGERITFYEAGNTGSSMFLQEYRSDMFQAQERITEKLDTVKANSFMKDDRVDYVKLDVQGAELVVLEGATEVLKQASFVQLEESMIEYNKGGSCFYEVDEFLRSHGFFLYDFGDQIVNNERLFRSKGTGQFDALYIRPTSPYLPQRILDQKPNFCGSDRPQGNARKIDTRSYPVSQGENTLNFESKEANILAPLVLGILIGRFLCNPFRRKERSN